MSEQGEALRRRHRRLMFLGAVPALLYLIAVVAHAIFPEGKLNEALSTRMFFAHFYAFPILFGGLILLLSSLILLVILLKHGAKGPVKSPFFLPWLLVLLASLVFVLEGHDAVKVEAARPAGPSFKIVSWNALNQLDQDSAREIFLRFDADVAVFPEMGGYERGETAQQRLGDLLAAAGIDQAGYQVFTSPPTGSAIAPVTLVVKRAHDYEMAPEQSPATRLGTVYLRSKKAGVPAIVGLHTAPPLPGLMAQWRQDLETAARELAARNPEAILAGDFNATMKHGPLGRMASHQDVLCHLPFYARGTWPVKLPPLLRSSIDHILLPAERFDVLQVEIVDLPGSDHAAIFVEIAVKQP